MGYILSLAFLVLLFKNIDYDKLRIAFKQYGYWRPLAASALYLAIFFIRGVRTQILSPVEMDYKLAVSSTILNFGFNNILPLKGGDLYKILYLKNKIDLSRVAGFGILFIERFFDLLVILFLLTISTLFISIEQIVSFKIIAFSTIAVSFLGVVSTYMVIFQKNLILTIVEKLPFKEIISQNIHKLLSPFDILTVDKKGIKVLALTVVIWLFEAMVFYILIYNFNSNYFISMIWMCLLAVSFLIPSAPGNIGIFEYVSCLLLIKVVNLDQSNAMVLAILAHFSQLFLLMIASTLIVVINNKLFNSIRFKYKLVKLEQD
jgi:hypothetical protein